MKRRPPAVDCKRQPRWLGSALASLKREGCCVVERALGPDAVSALREAMYRVQPLIRREVGEERLAGAGELGVLRLMLKFHPAFLRLLELPEMLAVVDAVVSPTAVLHLQNGFILPRHEPARAPRVFQNRFHRDFPRYLNGYVASVNAFFCLDDFSAENGATRMVPGSHQRPSLPSEEGMERRAVSVECPAGSMLLFDSTLWHAAGSNASKSDRLAINHQFTRSFIKQQIDYVRALGIASVERLPPRSQQLLGYYTRVVTSLDEYYRPESERLYRRGQG